MSVQTHDSATELLVPTAPTTGQTVTLTVAQPITTAIIAPAGTLAALTVAISGGTIHGQRLTIVVTQVITAFTCPGDGTYVTKPTALTAGQKITFVYNLTAATWYYIGA